MDNKEKNTKKKKNTKNTKKKANIETNKNIEEIEKIEVIEEINDINENDLIMDKPKDKNTKINKGLTIPFVILAILSFIAYIIYEFLKTESIMNSLPNFIGSTFMFLFILCFIIIGFKSKNKKVTPFIILGSLILIAYSGFNILFKLNYITLPKENSVLNFYNQSIAYAKNWGTENHIDIEEIYEYSDVIKEYHIISQDIEVGTLTREISKITFIISNGPNPSKEVIVPSFIGWEFDKVIEYIENNFLNNVQIDFVESNNKANTVIDQVGSGTMKRNDLVKLTFSQDEISPIEIIDFTNKSLLYSTSWLKMHGFKYELKYVNNDNINKNYVVMQDIKNEVKDPITDTITLTISKGKMIVIPDINNMTQEELNKWIMDNNLKVNYNEVYSEEINYGNIIESNYEKGEVVEVGDTIKVTISKGKLEMIKLTNLTDFYLWAQQNKIDYSIEYEYSDSISKDEIIKSSHKQGDLIKTDDSVIIYVSKGKSVTIPSFISMSKTNISAKCNELKLSCSFTYGGYTESTKKDIATKQSKTKGSVVSEGTNLVITLSSGIYEKVTIPNFVGKTKNEITNTCKNVGLTCSFVYESNFSNTSKDVATKQSKTGKVNKGTKITITLSKGPAKTYTIVIDPNQLTAGNPNATKATLKAKLEKACPGVTFTYVFQKSNSAIGYLAQNSQVKVGNNTFTQGKTYKVIINSN